MIEEPKDRLARAVRQAGYESPTEAWRANKRQLGIGKDLLISNANGNRAISKKAAAAYARVFGHSAGWYLYGDGEANGVGPERQPIFTDVPLISWISAGQLADQDAVLDWSEFNTVAATDLPAGDWIALKVEGNSMNKISPPESTILVNRKDKRLVANACYVIADETGRATYKRYRPNAKPPYQPASYEKVEPPKLEGAITVIGRVRRSSIDM